MRSNNNTWAIFINFDSHIWWFTISHLIHCGYLVEYGVLCHVLYVQLIFIEMALNTHFSLCWLFGWKIDADILFSTLAGWCNFKLWESFKWKHLPLPKFNMHTFSVSKRNLWLILVFGNIYQNQSRKGRKMGKEWEKAMEICAKSSFFCILFCVY